MPSSDAERRRFVDGRICAGRRFLEVLKVTEGLVQIGGGSFS